MFSRPVALAVCEVSVVESRRLLAAWRERRERGKAKLRLVVVR